MKAMTRQTLETHVFICKRYERLAASYSSLTIASRLTRMMDLEKVAEHCPIDFDALLAAPDGDFLHNVAGIHNHIDRETGELRHCFLPRFARPESERKQSTDEKVVEARDHAPEALATSHLSIDLTYEQAWALLKHVRGGWDKATDDAAYELENVVSRADRVWAETFPDWLPGSKGEPDAE